MQFILSTLTKSVLGGVQFYVLKEKKNRISQFGKSHERNYLKSICFRF